MQPILVTGGAGFIGGEFVRQWIAHEPSAVINLDKLTYAGNIDSLVDVATSPRHIFIEGDFGDSALVQSLLQEHRPRGIVNFAAESHVDRSIDGPAAFVETNVVGTFRLLEEVRHFWKALPVSEQQAFRFLHVSTDEVYGSLGTTGKFLETTPYAPNSPYSASKAASDHFVRAYHHTYGLPTLTTNCSNNYGPYQFPEKLIPLMILNCLEGKALPVYGDGGQIRDWLYVADHCRAIRAVFAHGRVGEVYNIGGDCERTNLEVVHAICHAVDRCCPDLPHGPCESLITSVKDRPGHDRRYAIDFQKINQELGWSPLETFGTGIERTVNWYLANKEWMDRLKTRGFDNERLGLESVRSFPALSKSVCSVTSEQAMHASEHVLIVGGMHRSGTSLLASLCEGAGVSMGDRLLGVGGGGNPKGHFEDCDFLEFHQQALLANGLNPAGYTMEAEIHVPEAMLDRAKSLIASRSGPGRLWGWKDPRTALFLDFWHALLPNAKYLFVFRSPWEVIESFFRRGDGEFIHNPSLAVGVWLHCNRLIVDFVKRHPSQCVLKELSQAVDDPAGVFHEIRDRLHVPIGPPPDRYDKGLLHRAGFAWRSTIVREYAPDAYDLYLKMQNMTGSRATLPGLAAAATGQSVLHSNGHSIIFEEWAQTSRTEMRAQQLESREKELTAQVVDSEQQRESLVQSQQQLAASHEQSLATLGRLSNLLDSLANQVASSSSEMAQIAGIVGPAAALPPVSVWLHDSHAMHPLVGIVEAKASALSAQLRISEDLIGQLKKQAAKGRKTFLNRMEQESRRLYGQTRTVLKKVEREIRRVKRKASACIT